MQAFAALKAERRWVATGTPIVNSPGQLWDSCNPRGKLILPGDLGSLLTCLRVCKPLDQVSPSPIPLLRSRSSAHTSLNTSSPSSSALLKMVIPPLVNYSKHSSAKPCFEEPKTRRIQLGTDLFRCPRSSISKSQSSLTRRRGHCMMRCTMPVGRGSSRPCSMAG
jgi:hypothetical protein